MKKNPINRTEAPSLGGAGGGAGFRQEGGGLGGRYLGRE
jgi:hypothetical protein